MTNATMQRALTILSFLLAAALRGEERAAAADIMARVAANLDSAEEARRQYVYQQKVRGNLIRGDGQLSRREHREYAVFPGTKGTEKKLVSFSGEYRNGKQMLTYSEPGFTYKAMDIDGELIRDLTNSLVDDKDSRDGIPRSLFPLRETDLPHYQFTMKGEMEHKGRRTYQILFEPMKKPKLCEPDSGNCSRIWKGEIWVDAAELQPLRIDTQLAMRIPIPVRVLLGTNLRQTGFSVTYTRVAENVWFPQTYGTEFHLNALWFYKRTITLGLESVDFRKTDSESKISYQPQ